MSVDRFEAISRPLIGLSWSKKRGLVYIGIAFICAHLQGIPQIMFFALRPIPQVDPPVITCFAVFQPVWLQNAYIVYTWLMQFLIPICIIIACYASISIKVLSSIKNKSDDNRKRMPTKRFDPEENTTRLFSYEGNETSINESTQIEKVSKPVANKKSAAKKHDSTTSSVNHISFRQHCTKNFSKSKMKTIKLTLTVIVLYIICSTPYFIGMIMNLLLTKEHYNSTTLSNSIF